MKKYVELLHNNEILRGYHHQVNSDKVVVMFHGFTGNKTETGSMFKKLSDKLESNKIDSIRFDYLGNCESDGLFSDMTLPHLINQANTILKYAKSHKYKEVIILGFSMGGALALNILDACSRLILIAPAVSFFANQDNRNLEVLGNGNYSYNSFELNKHLFDSFDCDYFGLASKYLNKVLIIQGTKDQSVQPKGSIKLQSTFPNAEILLIKDATHLFHNRKHYQTLESGIVKLLTS